MSKENGKDVQEGKKDLVERRKSPKIKRERYLREGKNVIGQRRKVSMRIGGKIKEDRSKVTRRMGEKSFKKGGKVRGEIINLNLFY